MSCVHCRELEAAAEALENERTYYKDTVAVCVASMQRSKRLRQRDLRLIADLNDYVDNIKKRMETAEGALAALRATTKK